MNKVIIRLIIAFIKIIIIIKLFKYDYNEIINVKNLKKQFRKCEKKYKFSDNNTFLYKTKTRTFIT